MDSETKKQLANAHYRKREFDIAYELYSEILDSYPENEIVRANRSAALLELGQFQNALQDAKKVLSSNPNYVKASYRAAQVHVGLRQYDKAILVLNSIDLTVASASEGEATGKLKAKSEIYLNQQKNGEYDLMALLRTAEKPAYHDIADYMGPLELVTVDGKGRGYIATEDIPAGQLIMASKAFATNFQDPVNCWVLLDKTECALKSNPERHQDFFKLYAGHNLELTGESLKDSLDKPIPIGCRNYPLALQLGRKRLQVLKILQFKMFPGFVTGFWIEPSFMNNDCINGNSACDVYGDVLLVRAVRNIKKGEEILYPYSRGVYSYSERNSTFRLIFEFECLCELCRTQRLEDPSVRERRDVLLEYFRKGTFSSATLILNEAEAKFRELKELCQNVPELHRKHYMFTARYVVALAYSERGFHREKFTWLKDLATKPELNMTDVYGPYGLGGYFSAALDDLLTSLARMGDHDRAETLLPIILGNFEVARGKVGIEGYLLLQSRKIQTFVKEIFQ